MVATFAHHKNDIIGAPLSAFLVRNNCHEVTIFLATYIWLHTNKFETVAKKHRVNGGDIPQGDDSCVYRIILQQINKIIADYEIDSKDIDALWHESIRNVLEATFAHYKNDRIGALLSAFLVCNNCHEVTIFLATYISSPANKFERMTRMLLPPNMIWIIIDTVKAEGRKAWEYKSQWNVIWLQDKDMSMPPAKIQKLVEWLDTI